MAKIELYTFSDWEVLLVNGEIAIQDHSLDAVQILEALDLDFASKVIDYGDDPKIDELLESGDVEGIIDLVRDK